MYLNMHKLILIDAFTKVLYGFISLFMQDPPGGFSSQEKTVSLKKEPRLSLGITIAGGRDCRSRLPVYITSVQPVGCLHRDGTIKKGIKQVKVSSVLLRLQIMTIISVNTKRFSL